MRELRRIDVLLNEETKEEFHEEDIVKVTTKGTYGSENIGRISCVDTLEMTLDMSKEYNNYTRKIEYKNILDINLISNQIQF